MLEPILVPVLSNRNNHESWSCFISQDVERHTEVMKNKVHILRGKISRRTHLPIPTVAENIDMDQHCSVARLQSDERRLLHAIESVVIKWSHQIQEILDKDSAQPLLNGLHPTPETELDFWALRHNNLNCIHRQVSGGCWDCHCKSLTVHTAVYRTAFKLMGMEAGCLRRKFWKHLDHWNPI